MKIYYFREHTGLKQQAVFHELFLWEADRDMAVDEQKRLDEKYLWDEPLSEGELQDRFEGNPFAYKRYAPNYEIGEIELDELLEKRKSFNSLHRTILDHQLKKLGIEVKEAA